MKYSGVNMPCLATSIIPLETEAPANTPTAATAIITLKGATFAPIAELMKLTASLLTPTTRSNIARMHRKTTMQRNTISIFLDLSLD